MRLPASSLPSIAAAFVIVCLAALAGLARADVPERLRFEHLTVDDGLPENTVRAILQDRTGFLWFGTHNGLVRFDGHDMVSPWHDLADTTAAPRFFVSSLVEDAEGVIWVGTILTGIWRIDPRTDRCTQVAPAPGPPGGGRGQHDPDLSLDADGLIWVTWNGYGVSVIDPRDGRVTWLRHDPDDANSLPSNSVNCLLHDPDGRLWLGSEGDGLFVRDPGAEGFQQFVHDPDDATSLAHDIVTEVHATEDGTIWVLTVDGLSRWQTATGSFRNYRAAGGQQPAFANYLIDATASDDVGLWIGAAVGLYHFDPATGEFRLFAHDPDDPASLVKGPVFSVLRDRSGVVWAGSWHAGLNKVDPLAHKFRWYEHDPREAASLDDNVVMSVAEDRGGDLWVGTGNMAPGGSRGGLNRFDPVTGGFDHLAFPPEPIGQVWSVQSLAVDPRGSLWVGTNLGLWRHDQDRGRLERVDLDQPGQPDLGDATVRCLLIDRSGNLWAGVFREGLYRIDPEGRVARFRHDPADSTSISQDQIICLAEDAQGRIWVGTDSRGLNLLDPRTGACQRFVDPMAGLASMITIVPDSRGRVWLGTYGGLLQFDPDRGIVARFTTADGLPHDLVSAIVEDGQGRLWLSTDRGLARLDPSTGDIRAYDIRDGLPGNAAGFAACRRRDGTLVFGGQHGLIHFDPERIVDNPFAAPVVLTELRIGDRPMRPGPASALAQRITFTDELSLAHDHNDISLSFAALHYSHPERNRYRCRLAPYDPVWREIGNRRNVTYTNLDPGRYVFEVQGTNGDGIWNPAVTRLSLQIAPPWWRTSWANAAYLLLAGGLIWLIYRQVVQRERMRAALEVERAEARQMHELDEFKSRFFANVTHEFRTPLTLIQGPLKSLIADPPGGDPSLFEIMARNARRLGQLIDQLLDLSRLDARRLPLRWQEGDCVDYLSRVAASFQSLAASRPLEFVASLPEAPARGWFDGDLVEKVAGNLLTNAFKFTADGGSVRFDLTVSATSTSVRVPAADGDLDSRLLPARTMELTVRNTGSYIPADEQARVFDRFHQLADGAAAGGNGIGLALVRELVEWQGGTITVASDAEQGTAFTASLPLFLASPVADVVEEAEAAGSAPPPDAATADLVDADLAADDAEALPLVLIVEDHADLREFLQLELAGQYRLLTAADGEEGCRIASSEVPDLIVTDLIMPRVDGIELCERVKADDVTSHVPVIMLTARAEVEDRLAGLRHGADAYLTKPFEPEELRVQIGNLIAQRRHLAEKFARRVVNLAASAMPVTSADERFLQRVRQVIEEHLDDEDFEVGLFSREIGLSRSQLHRKLKALTGRSAGEVIRAHRLQRAAELLGEGYGNVTEVTYAVGFRNLSYFSRCFREQYGVSPSDYLRDGKRKH